MRGTTSPPTIGSLCTGYGGLDLAVEALTGGETHWVSEIDPHAITLLEHRFPKAPNIGDLTALSYDPEPVDIVTAGFPCQPLSQAGHRKGVEDERWIWSDILALIRRMEPRPRLLLFENVAGLLTANGGHAMARVIEGLASIGYLGAYRTVRASDVGACHRRERIFIVAALADTPGIRVRSDRGADRGDEAGGHRPAGASVSTGPQVAHPEDSEAGDRSAPRLMPTPAAWDGMRGPDLARAGRPESGGMDLVTTAERLLPTPLVTDAKGAGVTPETGQLRELGRLLPTPTSQSAKHGSTPDETANGFGSNLWDLPHLLPTPTAWLGSCEARSDLDAEARRQASDQSKHKRSNEVTTAVLNMLPTPTAGLATSGNINRSGDRADELLLGGIMRRPEVFGDYADAIARHELAVGYAPPNPTDGNRRLNPAFVEWMMMLPPGWVTDLELSRTASLKILGNGVVPAQAFFAYSSLLESLS